MLASAQLRFFLDSGAYSAWSRKAEVDLDEYIAFIKANIDHIDVYANLDAIPGVLGGVASAAERERAAQQSWDNLMYMREHGLDPLPVFHIGEDWSWLQRMRDLGCDYIGLGGLVGQPAERRRAWLDQVFDRICDADGQPLLKTHGFGMTAIPLIFRYPWFSIDSTTWIKITANGAVYLPATQAGKFIFDEIPDVISVSDRNPGQAQAGKHGNSLQPAGRKLLDRWLEECGKTYAQVCESYYHRAVVNVRFFTLVAAEKQSRPFIRSKHRRTSLW